MTSDASWRDFGDALDDIITPNLRAGATFSFVKRVHRFIRERTGAALALSAARALASVAQAERSVVIATGFRCPPDVMRGETDGPIGAAALAVVLHRVHGAHSVVVCEPEVADCVRACLRALLRPDDPVTGWWSVEPFPRGGDATIEDGRALIERLSPSAAIAVEKAGICADGTYRSAGGTDISSAVIGADAIFRAAADAGVPTLSMADAVNEVGVGRFGPSLVELFPARLRNSVSTTPADHVVIGTTANWAAFGVSAALALLAADPAAMITTDESAAALDAAITAGAVDAALTIEGGMVDGLRGATDRAVVAFLRELLSWSREWLG
jgi:hypothetical protein